MISRKLIEAAMKTSDPTYALNVLCDYLMEQYDRSLLPDNFPVDTEGFVLIPSGPIFYKSQAYATAVIKELRKYNMKCVDTRLNYTDLCMMYKRIFGGVEDAEDNRAVVCNLQGRI